MGVHLAKKEQKLQTTCKALIFTTQITLSFVKVLKFSEIQEWSGKTGKKSLLSDMLFKQFATII